MKSQDIHFSQFNENSSLIDPALTGASSSFRASVTNRDQWRSVTKPYKTIGASVEKQFASKDLKNTNGFSMLASGISFYKDLAGAGNLGQTQVNLSLASFVTLNAKNFISVGLQGSVVQRMVDNGKLLFPNQYDGNTYNSSQSSNENFTNLKFTYFDVGAGAQWTYRREQQNMDAYKQFRSHLGFAAYHLAQPQQKYLGTLSKLYVRYVSHGDLTASIPNTHMAFSPSYVAQLQGPSLEIMAGATLRHYIKTESKYTGLVLRDCFGYGVYYRSKDALAFSALFERQEKLAVILSYDVNVSSLKKASALRGGFEITLRYTDPRSFFYKRKSEAVKE
jgi:type IX secretion system PorP/SprF family membrane protein